MKRSKKKLLVVEHLPERVNFFIEQFGHHHLDIVESAKNAIEHLDKTKYDFIFLSGELGRGDGSGSDVVNWLIQYRDDNGYANDNLETRIIVHTWNIMEMDAIAKVLPSAMFLPFDVDKYSTIEL